LREEREQKKVQIVIQDIETCLGNSPSVNISEIDKKFHNYKNSSLSELEKISDRIIEAIKNKRSEKQLIKLIEQTNNCPDNDL
jgi:hypothetical protein